MKKHGISLIVLVITIIVMIIIAGAVILTLTQTNIIDQAQNAVGKHNDTELKQRITLTLAEAQANRYSEEIVTNNLKVLFEEVYGKDDVTVVKSGNNYKVKLKDSNEVLKVKTDGTIEEYKEMAPTPVYARLDDEGVLYLRATEKEGYNLYTNYKSIQADWNTAGDATPATVVKVIIEEEIAPVNLDSFFAKFVNLTKIEKIENLHTENAKKMGALFYECKKLAYIDIVHFDTQNVTGMASMFYACEGLVNIDLTNFETNNVTTMASMFKGCKKLVKLDISSFDTSNVKDMYGMFQGCSLLENITLNNFDTSNVQTMGFMFDSCKNLTSINLNNFYTENVTNMSCMFANCHLLTNINISNFNTMKVENMKQMFTVCKMLETIKLGEKFIINDGVDLTQVLTNVPSDIKITATEATRDKLISASSLTNENFEIIEEVE